MLFRGVLYEYMGMLGEKTPAAIMGWAPGYSHMRLHIHMHTHIYSEILNKYRMNSTIWYHFLSREKKGKGKFKTVFPRRI